MYSIEEGKFSMYLDALEGKMGPSSFCEEDKMESIDLASKNPLQVMKKVYRKF